MSGGVERGAASAYRRLRRQLAVAKAYGDFEANAGEETTGLLLYKLIHPANPLRLAAHAHLRAVQERANIEIQDSCGAPRLWLARCHVFS